jgi:hypothetical protein
VQPYAYLSQETRSSTLSVRVFLYAARAKGQPMSIKVMSRVWEHSKQKEGALIVLLAIADFADDGGHAFPSIPILAKKARLSDRQTQRLVEKLEAEGELKIHRGTGRGHSHSYTVLARIKGDNTTPIRSERKGDIESIKGDTLTPFEQIKGDIGDIERVTLATVKGDIGDSAYKAEPSGPVREPSVSAAPTKQPARSASPPPSLYVITDQHRQWAAAHAPTVDLKLETDNWLDHHRSKGSMFKDWGAAWRLWMRNAGTKYAPRSRTQAEMNRGGRGLVE